MYVNRNGKWLKVRNFTQRLRAAKKWSPCEGEAWMIRVAVENHGPWICQSGVSAEINTDSSACVLSFQRLRRGKFSKSVRLAFLHSTLAEFDVYVVHRAGSNHPGDFDSRHPMDCILAQNAKSVHLPMIWQVLLLRKLPTQAPHNCLKTLPLRRASLDILNFNEKDSGE